MLGGNAVCQLPLVGLGVHLDRLLGKPRAKVEPLRLLMRAGDLVVFSDAVIVGLGLGNLYIYVNISIYISVSVSIDLYLSLYIYIYRERERERAFS